MEYENDFVGEDLIEFEVEDRKFKYKPITAGDELDWLPEYMDEVVDNGETKRVPNLKKMTLCKLRNIKEVPYTKDNIKNVLGIEKEFSELTNQEKDLFWSKINSTLADKIVRAINELSNQDVKKNLPSE